jgi:hypothetical protein
MSSDPARLTEARPEHHDNSEQEASFVLQQEAPRVENPPSAPQDDSKQTTSNSDSKKGFAFPSATANVRAYQAKLLEMAQAEMQLAFEFAERLAVIRSPVEFPRVIAEITGKRITMFMDHSKEMAALSVGRRTG